MVNIRTAPVSVPQQFFTFPSRNLGMGGSLALNDLEADPFSNPATAARIRSGLATISPSLYHVGDDQGFGRALPITVMGGGPAAFGVLSLAPQELETTPRNGQFWQTATPDLKIQRFAHNFYTYAAMGQRFDQSRSAVAIGISYANLNRVHMVDLLYPEARAIDQGGYLADVRLGYTKELQNSSSIEATVVRDHVDMEHTVTYIDNIWSPTLQRVVTALPRVEYNADRTTTWGAQFGFKGPNPVGEGWRLAGSFTANTKTHPKIPNYNFMRIPKDPGNS
ncbi:MAG TPA: hypothetical protein VM100_01290, partial [Longimicrobiales bacterium]|nr:hypothetical protein [Longimicrobiales bacterium]